jgi:CheY-like chemotaxis protein
MTSVGSDPGARPVLIVDDDPNIRETLGETLIEFGHDVVTAANGREALDMLRRAAPDRGASVVLLDLMMPVLDGYGFLDEQSKDAALASLPVIVVTAGYNVDRSRLGAERIVLQKPIELKELLALLKPYRATRAD